ncbi:MAG: nitrilase-related carbon-nitrogen hydrolase, partial [Bacteroidota bacterium]
MRPQLKLAGACLNQTPIDWGNNLTNIREAIKEAKKEGVAILCLPELCITGYG